jgi:hypothetical protein
MCNEPAGLLKRICVPCAKVIKVVETSAGSVGWTQLVDRFAAAGVTQSQVDRALDAEIDGAPALRDRLTAEMANVLMRNLGMPGRQSPEDVRRVRRAAQSGAGERTWQAGEPEANQD